MSRRVRIAPSLLSADFGRLAEEVAVIEAAGADQLHIDVMDGHFVPNLSFGAMVVEAIRPATRLPFDVHLMVQPVDPLLPAFIAAGADCITFHPEAGPHPHRTIQVIRDAGRKAGLALSPGTPLAAVEELLPDIDLVLVMTVNPGFGGQRFIASQLSKIARLRRLIDEAGRPVALSVDGGINAETAPAVRAAGADILVAGTAVFTDGPAGYAARIAGLRGDG